MALANGFYRSASQAGCVTLSTSIYFPDLSNSISNCSTIFVGMHKGCTWNHIVIEVAFPPPKAPKPLVLFICKPLNNKEHAISLPKFHKDFLDNGYTASNPTNSETPTHMFCAKGIYKIHQLTKCYRLHNNITYILAHLPNFLLLDWSTSTKHNEHMCAFLGTPSSPSTV